MLYTHSSSPESPLRDIVDQMPRLGGEIVEHKTQLSNFQTARNEGPAAEDESARGMRSRIG
jgi:hypothetical protein